MQIFVVMVCVNPLRASPPVHKIVPTFVETVLVNLERVSLPVQLIVMQYVEMESVRLVKPTQIALLIVVQFVEMASVKSVKITLPVPSIVSQFVEMESVKLVKPTQIALLTVVQFVETGSVKPAKPTQTAPLIVELFVVTQFVKLVKPTQTVPLIAELFVVTQSVKTENLSPLVLLIVLASPPAAERPAVPMVAEDRVELARLDKPVMQLVSVLLLAAHSQLRSKPSICSELVILSVVFPFHHLKEHMLPVLPEPLLLLSPHQPQQSPSQEPGMRLQPIQFPTPAPLSISSLLEPWEAWRLKSQLPGQTQALGISILTCLALVTPFITTQQPLEL